MTRPAISPERIDPHSPVGVISSLRPVSIWFSRKYEPTTMSAELIHTPKCSDFSSLANEAPSLAFTKKMEMIEQRMPRPARAGISPTSLNASVLLRFRLKAAAAASAMAARIEP